LNALGQAIAIQADAADANAVNAAGRKNICNFADWMCW